MQDIDERVMKLGNFKIRGISQDDIEELTTHLLNLGVKMRDTRHITENVIALSVCVSPEKLSTSLYRGYRQRGISYWAGREDHSFENSFDNFIGFKEVTIKELEEKIGFRNDKTSIKEGDYYKLQILEPSYSIRVNSIEGGVCKCTLVKNNNGNIQVSNDYFIPVYNLNKEGVKIHKSEFLNILKKALTKIIEKI